MATLLAPRFITVPTVARRLGVSRGWVYSQVEAGRLPAVALGDGERRGRVIRISERDLDEFIATRTATSQEDDR